jgi:predicted nucleotide-binding protein (sugar kinase/HSP70/actin superfamily)
MEKMLFEIIKETNEIHFQKNGKNFYISNIEHNIKITINSNSYRIITVDRITKNEKQNDKRI